jgi:hypothetical protein
MSYTDIVICTGSLPILETWPPIYRGQERTERNRLKASQVYTHVYFRYTPCLTDFNFKFIWRPTPPILSPSYWTFAKLTLVSYTSWHFYAFSRTNLQMRCHSASSLYSAIFVFQKSYIGNILGIGRNKSWSSYFSRHETESKAETEGSQGPATP